MPLTKDNKTSDVQDNKEKKQVKNNNSLYSVPSSVIQNFTQKQNPSFQQNQSSVSAKSNLHSVDHVSADILQLHSRNHVQSFTNLNKNKALLSQDKFDQLVEDSDLKLMHLDVIKLIYNLQSNPSELSNILQNKDKSSSILNTINQDLSFFKRVNLQEMPKNKQNQEMVRYIKAINNIILPTRIAESLRNDKFSTAILRLKFIQKQLMTKQQQKHENISIKRNFHNVQESFDRDKKSWSESFNKAKKAQLGMVSSYNR